MKNKQRDHISSIDDFEDLTLFANESFDTEDVDLFEFTSEESSPLTRLKSIILSLDWEINDEILQELDDELHNLQPMWQGDKVADVYLQGLRKIGNYIRNKGAYAHPNSIKLLLTFFYNFEKIISSQQITGDQITKLLKADVRKFKILQYQINLTDTDSIGSIQPKKQVVPDSIDFFAAANAGDIAKQLKAAVLSLDWEVTQESLDQFNMALAAYHQKNSNNKPALVLLQGLQALGDYIADEKANAHPESFTLLHSFNDALERVTEAGQTLSKETIQELLVDRINRLNNLKILIATPSGALIDEHRIEAFVEGLSSPDTTEALAETTVEPPSQDLATVTTLEPEESDPAQAQTTEEPAMETADISLANELDSLFGLDISVPAMESSAVQYPDEVLPMDAIEPVEDELADERIESQLGNKRGIKPALADTDEVSGFDESAEPFDSPVQNDLADQLDLLFADSLSKEPPTFGLTEVDEEDLEEMPELHPGPIATLTDMDALAAEESDQPGQISGDVPAGQSGALVKDAALMAIESKLDSFFDDEDQGLAEQGPAIPASIEEIEQSLYFEGKDAVQAALADSDEDRGFSEEAEAATLDTPATDEIEQRLDLFFDSVIAQDPDSAILAAATKEPGLAPPTEGSFLDVALAALSAEEGMDEPPLDLPFDDKEFELTGALDQFFAADLQTEAHDLTMDLVPPLETPPSTVHAESASAPAAPAQSLEVPLAALGALLPGLVRAPSREQVAQVADQVTALKTASLSVPQQCLVALLDSVLTMLIRLPAKEAAATEKLVNFLYQQLSAAEPQSDAVAQAIFQFNQWLQQACEVMPIVPAVSADRREAQPAYTAKELYFELAEVRGQIRDEFARLRHDLHHHK